ncbi:MAG: nucleoside hydrolase, partial [Caldilineaceae bacterium]|nr:nucleoside hydrolase [Caldilineaceae bacterium]
MREKILLDTDIGSDIDDAVALAYLLAQPRCELLGITTVTGEPEKRAMIASAQCKLAGKDVPIYPGAAEPLLIAQRQPHAPQATKLDRWEHDANFPKGEAIEFLRHTIRAHPGEITLFAIGPLTNIALLFHSDSEIPSLLKQLVLMCGVFRGMNWQGEALEWNAIL